MQILAVDDDPIIHDLLRQSLSGKGFADITTAESAEDAMEIIERSGRPFETFLLDIQLPDSDGIRLCERIRAIPEYKLAPIIMITASRKPELMERAFAAGATDYVTKPFDGLELATRLNLAAMLSRSIMRERMNRHTLWELSRQTRISFDERVSLSSVYGVSDFLEVENSLLRSSGGCYALSLMAVEICGARALYNAVPPSEFRQHLEQVAAAISKSVDVASTQIAYAGRGLFVLVKHGRKRTDLVELEQRMQSCLNTSWLAGSERAPNAPELHMREISGNRLWSGTAASNALNNFLNKTSRVPVRNTIEENRITAAMRRAPRMK